MADIQHRIVIEAPLEDVYSALTEQDKLSAWWTRAETSGEEGSIAGFFFGPNGEHRVDMKITELDPNRKVTWKCISGPWIDTVGFEFQLIPDERGTALQFSNMGWAERNEFYMHCNSKWGFFLVVSLKNLLENGRGQPHPNEPSI